MRQYIEIVVHVRANDEDGYGIVKVAVPTDMIRWEGTPRGEIAIDDIYETDIIVTGPVIESGRNVADLDLVEYE